MELHYVSRETYRKKHDIHYQKSLKQQFGNVYIVPEGGSNLLALKGCKEIVEEIKLEIPSAFDVICCASGTGATLAGLVSAINAEVINKKQHAIGFSALKGGNFLQQEVNSFLQQENTNSDRAEADLQTDNWHIESRYHFAGYAKINHELIQFMRDFQLQYGFELDAVYTAKMFYGLFELIKSGSFQNGSTIVALHSGGLQGNKGFNLQALIK